MLHAGRPAHLSTDGHEALSASFSKPLSQLLSRVYFVQRVFLAPFSEPLILPLCPAPFSKSCAHAFFRSPLFHVYFNPCTSVLSNPFSKSLSQTPAPAFSPTPSPTPVSRPNFFQASFPAHFPSPPPRLLSNSPHSLYQKLTMEKCFNHSCKTHSFTMNGHDFHQNLHWRVLQGRALKKQCKAIVQWLSPPTIRPACNPPCKPWEFTLFLACKPV